MSALPPVPPPRPLRVPMDPRIHARRVAVRQEAARRRRRWWAAAGGVAVVAGATVGVSRSPLLAVHHVKLTGAGHTSEAAVLAATGLGAGPLMTDLSMGRLRAEVEALPWVAKAGVQRHWPATVDIHLTERSPVAAAIGAGGGPALLDQSGRVLSDDPNAASAGQSGGSSPAGSPPVKAPVALPTITGLAPVGSPGSSVAATPGVRDALLLAAALPAAIAPASPPPVQGIAVADGTLDAKLSSGATVVFGTADQLDSKLLALRTLLQRVDLRGVATIDVRVPTEPVLTRAGQASTVSTIPRG